MISCRRTSIMKITNSQIIARSIFVAISVFLASGNGGNISKFLKCQCIVHDPTALQNVSCWAKAINRTYGVANMRGNIIRVLDNLWINFQLHKRTQIEYRPFLINVTENYCDFFAKNKASKILRIVGSIYLPYTNLNHTCPYFGEVAIKDVPMTTDKLPSTWPTGEYRMDVFVLQYGLKILKMEFFLEIIEKPFIWNT